MQNNPTTLGDPDGHADDKENEDKNRAKHASQKSGGEKNKAKPRPRQNAGTGLDQIWQQRPDPGPAGNSNQGGSNQGKSNGLR